MRPRFCFISGTCLSLLLLLACQAEVTTPPNNPTANAHVVEQHCGRCHAVPTPQDLDQATWKNYVLPRMGYFMGIYDAENTRASLIEENAPLVEQLNIFPKKAIIDSADWQKIKKYYLENAPMYLSYDTLKLGETQSLFGPRFPATFFSPPGTLLTRFSPSGGYFIADVHKNQLLFNDQQQQIRAAFNVEGGIVDLHVSPERLLLTSIGSFSPTDQANGSLLAMNLNTNTPVPTPLISGLRRPVQASVIDLNGDQREDVIIPEFGKWTGGLSWWEQLPDGNYQEHELRRISGALRVATTDLNGDDLPDIIALFGQGDEGFWAFLNQGDGTFKEELLFRLPPSYGSSFFTLVDWNEDGRADILYTNGDNADYPPIIKPYHGIRLYQQDEWGNFSEAWFEYLPGAYQARLADFDQDGDQDLLAISFFPDYQQQGEQSIVLFENNGNVNFSPKPFQQATAGRWITMDIADNDRDGDLDVLLGSMAFEVIPPSDLLKQWINNGLGWLYLENLNQR
ncbi:MAG: VCBS repeat-containing protein [Bacteroidota bacterium]